MKIIADKRKRGITLVETIIYVFIFTLLLIVVVNSLVSMTRSYRHIQANKDIETSAIVFLERVTREIRFAKSVDIGQSSFDTSNGSLYLNTLDESGALGSIRFYLLNSRVHVNENSYYLGPLTLGKVSVSDLMFSRIATPKAEAIKIVVTLQSGEGGALRTKKFYSTVVLRGSYSQQ